jgi:hypothetical protein
VVKRKYEIGAALATPYYLSLPDNNVTKNQIEQQKIASTLSSIDELINAQSQKIEAMQLHKKGLLQGLFPKKSESEFAGLKNEHDKSRKSHNSANPDADYLNNATT